MGPVQSVKTCLTKYADFSGRAPRSEYWWWCGICWLTAILLLVLFFASLGDINLLSKEDLEGDLPLPAIFVVAIVFIFALGAILPTIAVAVRRLHDINLSGLWLPPWAVAYVIFSIGEIKVVVLILFIAALVVAVIEGTPGRNNHGPNPL